MGKFPEMDARCAEQVKVLTESRVPNVDTELETADTFLVAAEPIKRIINKETGFLVGWLYRWDNGHLMPRWKSGPHRNVRYEDLRLGG